MDFELLKEHFSDLVGFQNSTDPEDPTLLSSVTKSRSSKYINEVLPGLLTTKNFDYSLIRYNNNIENWIAGSYVKGDLVIGNNIYFQANQDTTDVPNDTGNFWDGSATTGDIIYFDLETYEATQNTSLDPKADPTSYNNISNGWSPKLAVKTLSDELYTYREGGINDLISMIRTEKSVMGEVGMILNSYKLLTKRGFIRNAILKESRLVGLEITLKERRGLAFILKSLAVQLTEGADFNIRIHSPNSNTPLSIINIKYTKEKDFQFFKMNKDLDFVYGLDSIIDDIDGSNTIYISYLEDELSGSARAIDRRINFARIDGKSCSSCSSSDPDLVNIKRATDLFTVRPFYVEADKIPANNELWECEDMVTKSDTNWGLNFTASVVCDETQMFIEAEDAFVSAIQYQTARRILEVMADSTRVSGQNDEIKQSLKERAIFEVNSEGSKFSKDYNEAMEGLTNSLKSLEWPCSVPKSTASIRNKFA